MRVIFQGTIGLAQQLEQFKKYQADTTDIHNIIPFHFVPSTRLAGEAEAPRSSSLSPLAIVKLFTKVPYPKQCYLKIILDSLQDGGKAQPANSTTSGCTKILRVHAANTVDKLTNWMKKNNM